MSGWHKKRLLLVCGLAAIFTNGCALLKTDRQSRDVHGEIKEEVVVVNTGGLLVQPKEIISKTDQPTTLLNAILASGGIKPQAQAISFVTQVTPQQQNVAVGEPDKEADESNKATVSAVLSKEAEIAKLFGVSNYKNPTEAGFVPYLRSALYSIIVAADFNFNTPALFDSDQLDPKSADADKLLSGLELAFEAYRDNNPEFANKAIQSFRSLRSPNPNELPTTPLTSTTVAVPASPQQDKAILIGLTKSSDAKTYYFHPHLVYKTAIGETELENGDFVFAIDVADTSLLDQYEFRDSFLIPVNGISTDYNSVDYSEYKTFQQIFGLYEDTLTTQKIGKNVENISILSRSATGKTATEIFYIPMWNTEDPNLGSKLVKQGRVRPGDNISFTYASRSPLVIRNLLKPIREQIANKYKKPTKQYDAKKEKKPALGGGTRRYLNKATTNFKYYTKPLVQNVTSVFN